VVKILYAFYDDKFKGMSVANVYTQHNTICFDCNGILAFATSIDPVKALLNWLTKLFFKFHFNIPKIDNEQF
jgi:hypothetical protein